MRIRNLLYLALELLIKIEKCYMAASVSGHFRLKRVDYIFMNQRKVID